MLWRFCFGIASLLLLPGSAAGSRHNGEHELSNEVDTEGEKKTPDELMKELDAMVGLDQVKEDIRELRDQVKFDMERKRMGIADKDTQSLHMAFLGNPGTGKTAVARIVGELLVAMGAISKPPQNPDEPSAGPKQTKDVVKEVSRAELVGQYKGKTAVQVRKAVQSAFGGVLFIDEAYSLVKDDRDTFGREAVDTLIKEMEDNRKYVVVILAGYREEMKEFFSSNPGFESRVAFNFLFQDYTCNQLMEIAETKVEKQRLAMAIPAQDSQGLPAREPACGGGNEPPTCKRLRTAITVRTGCCQGPAKDCNKENRANGNGRSVRNVLEASFRMMAQRVMMVYPKKSIDGFKEKRRKTLPQQTKDWRVNAVHCWHLPHLETALASLRGSPHKSSWSADREILSTNETVKALLKEVDYRCIFSLLDDSDFYETFLGMLQDGLTSICRLSKTTPSQISDLIDSLRDNYNFDAHTDELLNLNLWLYGEDGHCDKAMNLLRSIKDRSVKDFTSIVQLNPMSMTESEDNIWNSRNDGDDDKRKPSTVKKVSTVLSSKWEQVRKTIGTSRKTFSGLNPAYAEKKHRQISDRKNRLQRQEKKRKERAREEALERLQRLEDLKARQAANKKAWAAKPKKKRAAEYKKEITPALGKWRLPAHAKPKKTKDAERSPVDELMDKLDGMIGLSTVKAQMQVLRYTVEFDNERKNILKDVKSLLGQSYHMKFLGNPGTGKTEVARIVGELLLELGVLSGQKKTRTKAKFKFVEVSRANLVASKVGQTATMVQNEVKKALGGVLFVDEAYSLVQSDKDTFGREAVDTLIQEMENKKNQVIVILAGYNQEMDTFLKTNPGFESRVPFRFEFADYSCDELNKIAQHKMNAQKIHVGDAADNWLKAVLSAKTGCSDMEKTDSASGAETRRDVGNGRTVRNILESAQRFMASRVVTAAVKDSPFDTQRDLDDEQLNVLYRRVDRSSLNELKESDIRAVAGDLVEDGLRTTCRLWGETPILENPVRHVLQAITVSEFQALFDVSAKDCEKGQSTINDIIVEAVAPPDDNNTFTFPELEELTGIKAVKNAMSELYASVLFQKLRAKADTNLKDTLQQSFHMRFVGNPGTGKTVAARVVAKLLVKLGVIQRPEPATGAEVTDAPVDEEKDGFIEASRSKLVGEVVGETAQKTIKAAEAAVGGVLFVDEAYSLVQGSEDSYGLEAVATLIKEMEDKRGELIVVLAGYEKEMDEFFESNPGFKSRVPFTFYFEDYTCDELFHIGSLMIKGRQLMEPSNRKTYEKVIRFNTACCERGDQCVDSRARGNGRAVRNLIEAAKRKMSKRVRQATQNADFSGVQDKTELFKRLDDVDFQQVFDLLVEHRLGVPCDAETGDLRIISQAINGISVTTMDELPETNIEREMKVELVHRVANDAAFIYNQQERGFVMHGTNPKTGAFDASVKLATQCLDDLATLRKELLEKLTDLCNPGKSVAPVKSEMRPRMSRSTVKGRPSKAPEQGLIDQASIEKGPLMQYVKDATDNVNKVVALPDMFKGLDFLLDLLDATLAAEEEEPVDIAHVRNACEWAMMDSKSKKFKLPFGFLEKMRRGRAAR